MFNLTLIISNINACKLCFFQEYKKKKRERLLKKIKDKLKYNIENSAVTNKSTGTKLTDLLEAISGIISSFFL